MRSESDGRDAVLPIYLVLDESASMAMVLSEVNVALGDLFRSLLAEPLLAEHLMLAVVGFSDDAEVLRSLSPLDVGDAVRLRARSTTNYGAVFSLLRAQIDSDIRQLKTNHQRVYRPVVIFVSDGLPTDAWEQTIHLLRDDEWRYWPRIVAFGVGLDDATVLEKIATDGVFISRSSISHADAFRYLFAALTTTLTESTLSVDGGGGVKLPVHVPGFSTAEAFHEGY